MVNIYRIIENNVMKTYMKFLCLFFFFCFFLLLFFYENSMATLVAMATVQVKNLNDISYETTEPVLMKFHILH